MRLLMDTTENWHNGTNEDISFKEYIHAQNISSKISQCFLHDQVFDLHLIFF